MAVRPSLEELIKDISPGRLNSPCHKQNLKKIARSITEWRYIAHSLGFEKSELEAIVSEYPNSIKLQRIEFLTRWRTKGSQSSTYMKLMKAFYDLERTDLVETVVELLTQEDFDKFDDDDAYTSYLRKLYRTYIRECTLQWPPIPHCEYINLILLKYNEVQQRGSDHQKANDKKPVKLEEILIKDQADRKVIVVEGAPGIGKSTFALNACQRWANHTLFERYDYVILLELRDPALQSAKCLADILPCRTIDGNTRDSEMAQTAARKIVTVDGETTLFIIDGWDVFPPESQNNSLIQRILFNPRSLSVNMSTIMITSRPSSSADLHRIASSRIEISGFRLLEVIEYFTIALRDNAKVDRLLNQLVQLPSLFGSCYTPLNAAIIVHVFLCLGEKLPRTLHETFCALVLNCIKHEVSKVTPNRKLKASLLSELPPDLKEVLNQIALLAWKASQKRKETLTEKDLEELGITCPFPTLGLLQSVESFTLFEKTHFYNFMHSSVQQFLSAFHISQLPPAEQAHCFDQVFELRFDQDFDQCFEDIHEQLRLFSLWSPFFGFQIYTLTIFKHLAGFTRLDGNELQESVLKVVQKYKEVRHKPLFLLRYENSTLRKRPFLSLVCCLYEAQNESLCKLVASWLEGEITFTHVHLEPDDCISVSYLLHFFKYNETVSVDLSYCYVRSHGIDLFCKELSNFEGQKCSLKLDITCNNICAEGAKSIASLLHIQQLVHLDLSSNLISDEGAVHIANTLGSNTSLLMLKLEHCGISDDGITALSEAVSRNCTLQELCLSENPFTNIGLMILSHYLDENKGLKTLMIRPEKDLEVTPSSWLDPSVKDIKTEDLKFKPLYECNLSVTIEEDLTHLMLFVIGLSNHRNLTQLDIGQIGIESDKVKEALWLVNKYRKEKGIQPLTLVCSKYKLGECCIM